MLPLSLFFLLRLIMQLVMSISGPATMQSCPDVSSDQRSPHQRSLPVVHFNIPQHLIESNHTSPAGPLWSSCSLRSIQRSSFSSCLCLQMVQCDCPCQSSACTGFLPPGSRRGGEVGAEVSHQFKARAHRGSAEPLSTRADGKRHLISAGRLGRTCDS